MGRRMEAPVDFTCPYRHGCPHLDHLSTTWVMDVYQEADELRDRYSAMESRYLQRIAELEQTLRERDDKIAQWRLQHQQQFKAQVKPVPLAREGGRNKRGAPKGHPPWQRRRPDHIDGARGTVTHFARPTPCHPPLSPARPVPASTPHGMYGPA